MVRLLMPAGLSDWVTDRVAAFPSEAPETLRWQAPHVAENAALPLYVGWFETIAIRPDGQIIRWSTEGEYVGGRPVEDRYVWLSALVDGSRRYAALSALLPPRPAEATDCICMSHPLFASGKILCSDCCGLGWVRPGTA